MATDFRNLAGKVNEARGTSLAAAFPKFKPFVPPGTSEEFRQYEQKYGIHPNDLGDNIRRSILSAQLEGIPMNADLYNRPLSNLGTQDFSRTRILPLPLDIEGAGAAYVPPGAGEAAKREPLIYDAVKILGETERLIDDYIITDSKTTKEDIHHEFIHRAIWKLRDSGVLDMKSSYGGFNLKDEDVVQLLDYVSGNRKEATKWHFKGAKGDPSPWIKRGNKPTTPEELLQKPEVLKFLMSIQQLAVEELKKQNIYTPISFGDLLK